MRHLKITTLVLLPMLFGASVLNASVITAVGPKASTNGNIIVGCIVDEPADRRLHIIVEEKHGRKENVSIVKGVRLDQGNGATMTVGRLPQVSSTYGCIGLAFPIANSHQVMMAASFWGGRYELTSPEGWFSAESLMGLGLERGASARQSLEVMTSLADEWGYCDVGATIIIADPKEIWVLDICGPGATWHRSGGKAGTHWAAKRLGEDAFFVGGSRAFIGAIPVGSKDFLHSSDLTTLAEQAGWIKKDEVFDFAKTFDPDVESQMNLDAQSIVLSRILPPGERLGRPWLGRVHAAVSRENLCAAFRSTAVPAAYSFISQLRPELPSALGCLIWIGLGMPRSTLYVPLYANARSLPEVWTSGRGDRFDTAAAQWAFALVEKLDSDGKFSGADSTALEHGYAEFQPRLDKRLATLCSSRSEEAQLEIDRVSAKNLEGAAHAWWKLAWKLVEHAPVLKGNKNSGPVFGGKELPALKSMISGKNVPVLKP